MMEYEIEEVHKHRDCPICAKFVDDHPLTYILRQRLMDDKTWQHSTEYGELLHQIVTMLNDKLTGVVR